MKHYFATKKHLHLVFIFTFFLLILPGCMTYKIPTQQLACANEETADHWLYHLVPRHRVQIRTLDLGHWLSWSLLGNDDDGIFGEGPKARYKPDQPASLKKAIFWVCRNPFHNFTFYVIGSAERENSEVTFLRLSAEQTEFFTYKPVGNVTFGGQGTSFYFGLHGWKPFASLRLAYSPTWQSEFYLGWRHRGNFGAKCTLLKKSKY